MPADVRAMVLAAGLGTRLRPLTDLLPKPLVPVLGVPLLHATLELLHRAGVDEVVVNLHHLPAVLRAMLDPRDLPPGTRLHLLEEPAILGTGGGLKNAERFLGGAAAVLLVNGDALLDLDLGAIVKRHLDTGAAATLCLRPNPDLALFAPVETDAGMRVRRIAGLPAAGGGSGLTPWLFAGVHVLDPRVLALLPAGVPSDVNRVLHPALIARGDPVLGIATAGLWSDVGTPARLLEANLQALAAPPAHLASLARAAGFTLAGGSAVGPEVDLDDGVALARSVLGPGVTVGAGTRIEDSLVFPGTVVGARALVRRAILGPLAAVEAGGTVADALLVGATRTVLR